VIHGGTNFGFTAGANSGGKGYEPDVTSYDYDAPINEQGRPTPKYLALRALISKHVGPLPEIPAPIPAIEIPEISMEAFTSIWSNLPAAIASVQPRPFEAYGQDYGFVLYATKLIGHKSGRLAFTDLHDHATIFLNGKYVGKLDRREGQNTIDLPKSAAPYPVLEILVEGMGRINFAQHMIDRKGITDRVTLNGMTLMNWEVYKLPFDGQYVRQLKPAPINAARRGVFFKGTFALTTAADTYIDMTNYQKGLVWVNGHNLGRYWDIGPQKRLYCPAPWLRQGRNEIVIFDLLQNEARPVCAKTTLY
jgi:beta-galactosidase GanA